MLWAPTANKVRKDLSPSFIQTNETEDKTC